jgi:hypothetical protein
VSDGGSGAGGTSRCSRDARGRLIARPPRRRGQYYDTFGKNKVRYAKFDWRVYHAPHFDVHYYPEEEHLLEKVISLAESAYDSLSQDFDFQIQEPTPLLIYKTHTDFLQNNLMNGFIPEGVGAFATPTLFRMVMPIDCPTPSSTASSATS